MRFCDTVGVFERPEYRVRQVFLCVKIGLARLACLQEGHGEIFIEEGQVEQGDEKAGGRGFDIRTQIHWHFGNNGFGAACPFIIGAVHTHGDRGHQEGHGRHAVAFGIIEQLRQGKRELGCQLVVVVPAVVFRHVEGGDVRVVVRVRLRHAAQAQITVFAVLGREFRLVGADTAGLDVVSHAFEIIVKDGADKLVKAASVRYAVLIFQIDGAVFVAAQKQITIGIVRADIVRRNIIHFEHDRRLVDDAVAVLLVPAHKAEAELRVTIQCGAYRGEQDTRVNRLGHADDVARCSRQIFMGCVHENGAIAVHIQQCVPICFIHVRHLQVHRILF